MAHPPRETDSSATQDAVAADELAVLESELDEQERPLLSQLGSARASSWLLSVTVHLVVLILLALLTYRLTAPDRGLEIEGAAGEPTQPSNFVVVEQKQIAAESDGVAQDVRAEVQVDTQRAHAPSSFVSPEEAVPLELAELSALLHGGSSSATPYAYLGGGSLAARTPEGRRKNGEKYGATPQSEAAVENALKWLAQHQRSDGSWSFDLQLSPCDGRCRHGRKRNEDTPTPATAATGLALLAFLGAGYTSDSEPYGETVQKGLYYLRAVAAETQYGYDWQQGGSMYGHGIALLAMSEAMGMMKHGAKFDSDLLHYVDRGSYFTVVAQHENGSWGYTPGRPGDTTITGWQLLSLVGAQKAGIQMRSDTFSKTRAFLLSVRKGPLYEFGYRSSDAEPTMTAIALTLMMYLGQTPGNTSFDLSVDKMAEAGPTLTNVYHDYYATLALHHFQHRDWEAWNTKLRDHLVATQATKGHEAGSWHFADEFGDVGGRLYTTAMCTLILEVYYRYLPLYDQPPEFPL